MPGYDDPATPLQIGAVAGEFTRLGIPRTRAGRARRLAYCAALLDRDELKTSAALTKGDAGWLARTLRGCTTLDDVDALAAEPEPETAEAPAVPARPIQWQADLIAAALLSLMRQAIARRRQLRAPGSISGAAGAPLGPLKPECLAWRSGGPRLNRCEPACVLLPQRAQHWQAAPAHVGDVTFTRRGSEPVLPGTLPAPYAAPGNRRRPLYCLDLTRRRARLRTHLRGYGGNRRGFYLLRRRYWR